MNSIRPKLEDSTIAARKHVTDAIPSVEEAIQVVEFARNITADRQWNIVTAALRGIPGCATSTGSNDAGGAATRRSKPPS